MKRTPLLTVAAFATALALGPLSPSAPPIVAETNHVTAIIERRTEAAETPPLAELYQSVLSFEPGAFTAVHSHTGGSYNTVLQGTVTLRIGDVDRTFGPGEGWTDEPGVLHVAGNTGTEGAQLIAAMVVERGMPPAVYLESDDEDSAPPPPEIMAMTKTIAAVPAGPLDVVEQAVDLDANAEAGLPIPAGPRLIGVLDGSRDRGDRRCQPHVRGWRWLVGADRRHVLVHDRRGRCAARHDDAGSAQRACRGGRRVGSSVAETVGRTRPDRGSP